MIAFMEVHETGLPSPVNLIPEQHVLFELYKGKNPSRLTTIETTK
jgi:hypothetical protein